MKSEPLLPLSFSFVGGIGAALIFPPLQGEGYGGDGVDCNRSDKQEDREEGSGNGRKEVDHG